MSIAPVVQSVRVKADPARTFDLFVNRMEAWWPHGRTIGKNPHLAILLEQKPGGRWFERDADGNETNWGKVLDWNPPRRLLLGWQVNTGWAYDPDLLTEVELTFAPHDEGGTLVTLEHRDLERVGADAAGHAEKLRGGWPTHLREFADYANANM